MMAASLSVVQKNAAGAVIADGGKVIAGETVVYAVTGTDIPADSKNLRVFLVLNSGVTTFNQEGWVKVTDQQFSKYVKVFSRNSDGTYPDISVNIPNKSAADSDFNAGNRAFELDFHALDSNLLSIADVEAGGEIYVPFVKAKVGADDIANGADVAEGAEVTFTVSKEWVPENSNPDAVRVTLALGEALAGADLGSSAWKPVPGSPGSYTRDIIYTAGDDTSFKITLPESVNWGEVKTPINLSAAYVEDGAVIQGAETGSFSFKGTEKAPEGKVIGISAVVDVSSIADGGDVVEGNTIIYTLDEKTIDESINTVNVKLKLDDSITDLNTSQWTATDVAGEFVRTITRGADKKFPSFSLVVSHQDYTQVSEDIVIEAVAVGADKKEISSTKGTFNLIANDAGYKIDIIAIDGGKSIDTGSSLTEGEIITYRLKNGQLASDQKSVKITVETASQVNELGEGWVLSDNAADRKVSEFTRTFTLPADGSDVVFSVKLPEIDWSKASSQNFDITAFVAASTAGGGGSMELKNYKTLVKDADPANAGYYNSTHIFKASTDDETLTFTKAITAYDLEPLGQFISIQGTGKAVDYLVGFSKLVFSDGSIDLATNSALFDPVFYALNNKDDVYKAKVGSLAHYQEIGASEGRDPNAFFDVSGYLAVNKDVADAGVDALEHFTKYGAIEGRDTSINFDIRLYLQHNADVATAGINALEHYLNNGRAEGRKAYEAIGETIAEDSFDAQYYLFANEDVAASGIDARAHFAEYGYKEGRSANTIFDPSDYLAKNKDVAAAGVDPLEHYNNYGWREGRAASSEFDTEAYLAANDDVAAAGLNPLTHYLQYGIYEGREIQDVQAV